MNNPTSVTSPDAIDETTMFGDMEQTYAELNSNYRNPGSVFEQELPLVIYNRTPDLPTEEYRYDKDLATALFRYPSRG